MAIHGELPGIQVTVCVDGRALEEFNVDNDRSEHRDPVVRGHEQNCTKTVFIESQTGKKFTIKIRVKKPYHMDSPNLSFRTFVDGQVVWKPLMRRRDYTTMFWKTEVIGPVSRNNLFGPPSTTRSMVFSEIVSTSNHLPLEEVEEHKQVMNPVGDIVVKIYRVSEGRRVSASNKYEFLEKVSDKKYSEKSLIKEAKSHGTTLGNILKVDPASTYRCEELDGNNYPIAIFRFKYRCAKALQDLGLIPKPEVESPLDLAQISRLSPDDQDQLRQFIKGLELGVKKEIPVKNKIKRESAKKACTDRPLKRDRTEEFVDLTEEEDVVVVAKKLKTESLLQVAFPVPAWAQKVIDLTED